MGAEAIELSNCILRFGCALDEFRVVVSDLADWMDKSPPPQAAYRDLMACCFIALDNHPWVRPVGIGEMLRRAIDITKYWQFTLTLFWW